MISQHCSQEATIPLQLLGLLIERDAEQMYQKRFLYSLCT